jgi:hypothetical protein
MHTLPIQPLTVGQFEKRSNDVGTKLRGTWITGNPEAISSAGYVDVEAAFYLPQVLVKLPAKIRQAVIVSGFQDDVLGYLYRVQCLGI